MPHHEWSDQSEMSDVVAQSNLYDCQITHSSLLTCEMLECISTTRGNLRLEVMMSKRGRKCSSKKVF